MRTSANRAALVALSLLCAACGATSVRTVDDPGGGTPDGSATAPAGESDGDIGGGSEAPSALPACVAEMTATEKAGQLIMVLVGDPREALELAREGLIGGYALVGSQDADVGDAIAEVATAAAFPLLASGDDEGGTVQRLRDVLGAIPSAAEVAETMTPEEAADAFGDYAAQLVGLGLNMNLGPSLDVGGGSGLGTRSFSDDPDVVAEYGIATAGAADAAGVQPVVKHWPGIGGGTVDPHDGRSVIADIDTLRTRDLLPFDDAFEAGIDAVMVSHAVVPGLTDDVPATLSRAAITDELRGRQGFDGLIVTDSLGMGAVATMFAPSDAVAVSIGAGADLALLPVASGVREAHAQLLAAIEGERIPIEQLDRSVGRVLATKGIDECPS